MKIAYFIIFISVASIILYSCSESELVKGERLSKTYCGACHLFPEPSLLDKKTWENGIMPKMAFRMGLDNFGLLEIPKPDQKAAASTIPAALINQEDWISIKNYYQSMAPDSLINDNINTDSLVQFRPHPILLGERNLMVTLIQDDNETHSLWVGTRQSKLYKLGYDFKIKDTIELQSPPSQILLDKDVSPIILQMGIMDPNDQPAGSLVRVESGGEPTILIDSLKRPVYLEKADLNNDSKDDFIICSFGNFTGSLSAYEALGNGLYNSHVIANVPGSRKVLVEDFDEDGDQDIMALLTQGDEMIQLFLNQGNFEFEPKIILRFPPVYGSNYFELMDFNGDGMKDILYTNGDNADYSIVVKPYHGLRIFLNQGDFKFNESYFYPLPGASQTIAHDYDGDGDLDIAAISFFPSFQEGRNGFVYLENIDQSKNFKPYTLSMASNARWLRMELVDLNEDKKMDLVLGALNFPIGVPSSIYGYWNEKNVSLLALYNSLNRSK